MNTLYSKMEANYSIHSTPRVMNIWYDHMSYLRTSTRVETTVVSDHQCIKFESDYWGLLQDLGVPPQFHPFVTKFNGYDHPADYKGTPDVVQLPDLQELEVILKVNLTKTN